jgi:hypothetical protein
VQLKNANLVIMFEKLRHDEQIIYDSSAGFRLSHGDAGTEPEQPIQQ